jgi:hypothetical protein
MARFYADEQFPKAVSELLHRVNPNHFGIICTNDRDRFRMANRIDAAVATEESLVGQLIRVVRPSQ